MPVVFEGASEYVAGNASGTYSFARPGPATAGHRLFGIARQVSSSSFATTITLPAGFVQDLYQHEQHYSGFWETTVFFSYEFTGSEPANFSITFTTLNGNIQCSQWSGVDSIDVPTAITEGGTGVLKEAIFPSRSISLDDSQRVFLFGTLYSPNAWSAPAEATLDSEGTSAGSMNPCGVAHEQVDAGTAASRTFSTNSSFAGYPPLSAEYLLSPASVASLPSPNVSTGLVGHYVFDGDSEDSSAEENDATAQNGATYSSGVPSILSAYATESALLDGVNDYFLLGSVLGFPDGYTVSCWIKTVATDTTANAAGDFALSIVQHSVFQSEICLGVEGGLAKHKFARQGGILPTTQNGTTVNDGSWHHLVAAMDQGDRIMRLYVDGVAQSTGSTSSYSLTPQISYIGRGRVSGDEFNGSLSDVRIYNREISASEVAEIYAGDYGGGGGGSSVCAAAQYYRRRSRR